MSNDVRHIAQNLLVGMKTFAMTHNPKRKPKNERQELYTQPCFNNEMYRTVVRDKRPSIMGATFFETGFCDLGASTIRAIALISHHNQAVVLYLLLALALLL